MSRSIRTRILVILLISQGVLTIFCASLLIFYIQRQREAVFDARLNRRITTLLTTIQVADERPSGFEFVAPKNAFPPNDLFVVRDSKGALIAGSSDLPSQMFSQAANIQKKFTFSSSGRKYRGRVEPSVPLLDESDEGGNQPVPRVTIAYAIPTRNFDAGSRRIIALTCLGSLFWIASSSFVASFAIKRGITPLGELAQQASMITSQSWTLSLSTRVREVSELSPLALALENLLQRLRHAFERERTFVSDAAHELKTVVAIQKSSLQVALQGEASVREYKIGIERALADLDRLEGLVHRMLSLASVEGSRYLKSDEDVDLNDTLLAACDQLSPLATRREVRFEIQRFSACRVRGDEGLLQTLWGVFLENAIRYSPPGSSIQISNTIENNTCVVRIQDHGSGIAEEEIPYIFDRFYRADSSRSRETGGFGLGLAIAKAIVERHNGRIEVESQLGRGTTISVMLPHLANRAPIDQLALSIPSDPSR